MRTNKTLRIASVLLIAVLMTTCIIGGTFAKYTTSVEATVKANTATWSVKVNGDITTIDIDLGSTTNRASDDNVVDGVIAPGTKGSFAFALKNESQVTAEATIKLDVTALPSYIVLTQGEGGDAVTLTPTDVAGKKIITLDAVTFNVKGESPKTEETVTVNWAWAFGESVNDNDNAGQNLTNIVEATIEFTQVD